MRSRDSKEALLMEGLVKKCPVDFRTVGNLISRAHIDLKTARRNLDADEECAYTYAYNAMLRAGLALMFSEGFRPEIKDKHRTAVRFAGGILGSEYRKLVDEYDYMRRKRHKFIYEPDLPCSHKEAKDALAVAGRFVEIVSVLIREKNPQQELRL